VSGTGIYAAAAGIESVFKITPVAKDGGLILHQHMCGSIHDITVSSCTFSQALPAIHLIFRHCWLLCGCHLSDLMLLIPYGRVNHPIKDRNCIRFSSFSLQKQPLVLVPTFKKKTAGPKAVDSETGNDDDSCTALPRNIAFCIV